VKTGVVLAAMPGTLARVEVRDSDLVAAGQTLGVLEAMKMETHVTAERDAVVEAVLVAPGDRVNAKELLLVLKPATQAQAT